MTGREMSLQRESTVGERLRFGEFELAPIARALWRRGQPVKIGSRALDILITLALRPGQILSKQDLTKLVWSGAFVDETALRVGVSAVRKVLGADGDRYIATVPGRGYCFVLEVEATSATQTAEPSRSKRLQPPRLPGQFSRVVGRNEVIAALATEATRRRLLSLVGSGGIGKTTVAVAVADQLRETYDAVAFVDLVPIENDTQMAAAVAAALGLNRRLGESPIDEIAAAVGDRRVLIVLDNCEHLVDLAAVFVEALIGSAPGVTILATSRERLRAAGEWVHQLAPLEAPPERPALTASEARSYPAAELFEERAAFALGGYKISDADAPHVAEVCRRLDGIALAIELAAGRLLGLGVVGLANSLEDRFAILTRGRRTALPRHQTLRATLDWSYRLLSTEEQAALRSLSVFCDGFTLDDAAFLMGPTTPAGEANDRLTSLLDKSLVTARLEGQTFRFRLLDTTRAYGQDKLEESGEATAKRRRHAQRFLEVCRAFAPGEEGQSSLRQATADIRAALDWSLVRGGDLSLGVDLTSAATPVFLAISLLREHKKHLDLALDCIEASAGAGATSETALRSEMSLRMAVVLAEYYTKGQGLAPQQQLERARELQYARLFVAAAAHGASDPILQSRCNRMLARGLSHMGQHDCAQQHIEQALPPSRLATPRAALHAYDADDITAARAIYARILWLRGYPDDAKAEAERCLAEALKVGHEQSTCWAIIFNIGPVAIWRGDIGHAEYLADLLLERSQRVFEHYYDWGLLYRQFLKGDGSQTSRLGSDCHSDAKITLPIQADLFATFNGANAGPDALASAQVDENIWCAPELLRVRAARLVSGGDKTNGDKAEAILSGSFRVAQQQGAKAWELRTVTTLAQLYLQSGRADEARAVLEPTLNGFAQGHDTRDLRAAIRVMSVLSS
jgi:predicted ATPase/DNA-binding winged helix-turn-helix (wHTH) protein